MALVLFSCSAVILMRIEQLQRRLIVLAVPIRFEQGYSISRPFTVRVSASYFVGIGFSRTLPPSDPQRPMPPDDFAAEFRVTSQGSEIVKGSNLDERGRGVILGEQTSYRYIGEFVGRANHHYDISLRVHKADPVLASAKPFLQIAADPLILQQQGIRAFAWRVVGVGFAIFGLIFLISGLASKSRGS